MRNLMVTAHMTNEPLEVIRVPPSWSLYPPSSGSTSRPTCMVTTGIFNLCSGCFRSNKVSTWDALAVSIAVFSGKSTGSADSFIGSATELPDECQLVRVITTRRRLNCAVHNNKDEIQHRGFLLLQTQSGNQLLFDPRKSCQLRKCPCTKIEATRDGINQVSNCFLALELSFSSAVDFIPPQKRSSRTLRRREIVVWSAAA